MKTLIMSIAAIAAITVNAETKKFDSFFGFTFGEKLKITENVKKSPFASPEAWERCYDVVPEKQFERFNKVTVRTSANDEIFEVKMTCNLGKDQNDAATELNRKVRAILEKKFGEPSNRRMEECTWLFDGGKRSITYVGHTLATWPDFSITATASDKRSEFKKAFTEKELKSSDADLL